MSTPSFAAPTRRLLQRNGACLNHRLLGWFMLFSLVPLLASNAVGYYRSRGILQSLVERYLAALAETEARHVRDRLDRQLLMQKTIVSGNEFLVAGAMRAQGRPAGAMGDVADRQALTQFLQKKLTEFSGYESLYLVTAAGRVAAFAGASDAVLTSPPWTDGDAPLVERFRRADGGREPELRIAAAIRGRYGEPIAYLGASVTLSGFRDLLQIPSQRAGHGDATIIDEAGRPVFASHPHGVVDYAASFPSPLIHLPDGSRARYTKPDGEDVLGAIAAIPGYRWRVITEVKTSEAFAELARLGGLSVLLELLLVCVLVGTAVVVSRQIVSPIRRLVAAIRRVAGGDLDARIGPKTQHDELGELERAFNEMTSALSESASRMRALDQEETRRAAQLATVGELATSIAHEIKNPVIGIAHGLDLVRRHARSDAVIAPIMDEMGRRITRIQRTVQELLTFARPATPSFGALRATELVDRAVRVVAPAADRASVAIHVQHATDLPHLAADEDMLHQAVVNVLMNAVQATPAGGHVAVSTARCEGDLAMEITDTGRGIRESDLDLVFKPFFTTRHTGTGLGLSITRELVQRHGGAVTIRSVEGVGTTVSIRLPTESAAASRESGHASPLRARPAEVS